MAGVIKTNPEWRVYYFDRPPVDSTTHTPSQIPDYIAGVIYPDYMPGDNPQNVGSVFVWEHDWYWFNGYYDPPRWEGGDLVGALDKLRNDTDNKITGLRAGWRGSFEGWLDLRELMESDPDFPRKSAYRRGEKLRRIE